MAFEISFLLKQVDNMPRGLLYLSEGLVSMHFLVCVCDLLELQAHMKTCRNV